MTEHYNQLKPATQQVLDSIKLFRNLELLKHKTCHLFREGSLSKLSKTAHVAMVGQICTDTWIDLPLNLRESVTLDFTLNHLCVNGLCLRPNRGNTLHECCEDETFIKTCGEIGHKSHRTNNIKTCVLKKVNCATGVHNIVLAYQCVLGAMIDGDVTLRSVRSYASTIFAEIEKTSQIFGIHEAEFMEIIEHIVYIIEERWDYVHLLNDLANVSRQSILSNEMRPETVTEHIAFVGQICVHIYPHLSKAVQQRIDLGHALALVFVHDTPEALAGDAYQYKPGFSRKRKYLKEKAAASKIGKTLGGQAGRKFIERWEEYEERESDEAVYVKACDQLSAALQNLFSNGFLWLRDRHTISDFLSDTKLAAEFDFMTSELIDHVLGIAVRNRYLFINA